MTTPILSFSGIAYTPTTPTADLSFIQTYFAPTFSRVGTPALSLTSIHHTPHTVPLTSGTHYTISVFVDKHASIEPSFAHNDSTTLTFGSSLQTTHSFHDIFSTEIITNAHHLSILELGLEIVDTTGQLASLPLGTRCRVEITFDTLPSGNTHQQPQLRVLLIDEFPSMPASLQDFFATEFGGPPEINLLADIPPLNKPWYQQGKKYKNKPPRTLKK